MTLVSAGPLDDLPTNQCVSIADGRAVVARVGDTAVAFPNECLHQASPLAGGIIKDDVLVCPLHFWRYELPLGAHVGSRAILNQYDLSIEEGTVWVDLPDEKPARSMREKLLDHAKDWKPS